MQGGYHQVASFFTRVLELPTVFGISHFTIEVTDEQDQDFHLQTNFFITILNPPLPEEGSSVGQPFFNPTGGGSGI